MESSVESIKKTNEVEKLTTSSTPMDLMSKAIQVGANADQLEKWMDLQERWEKSQGEKAYAASMHSCQTNMPKVIRDGWNPQTRSKYAKIEDIQKACRETYAANGFSLSFGESDCPLEKHKRTICDVLHVGGLCRQYHLDLPVDGIGAKGNPIGNMNPVQGCVSTTSYGQRRLTCMIFNITVVDEDNDGAGTDLLMSEQHWIELSDMASQLTNERRDKCLKWLGVAAFNEVPERRFHEVKLQIVQALAEK